MSDAPGTQVPGSPTAAEQREAISAARRIIASPTSQPSALALARQFLRALGLPEHD